MSATRENLKDAVAQRGRLLDARDSSMRRGARDASIPGLDTGHIHILPIPSTGKAVTPMEYHLPDRARFVELIEPGSASDA
jgi:hypothetical protein